MAKLTYTTPNQDLTGYLGKTPTKELQKFVIEDDRVHEIFNIVVHSFIMPDSDDVNVYVAQPLLEWQRSEPGAWVMSHAVEPPLWHRNMDHVSFGWRYSITAKLKGADHTYYALKYGQII